jgi:hypothetical protein
MALKAKIKKQPYIKVRYKVDHPNAGIKAGDVVPIAYKVWANVPANIKENVELVEGPETIQDLKEAEIASLEELKNKIQEEIDEANSEGEEEEEDESEQEPNAPPKAKKKKTTKKRR